MFKPFRISLLFLIGLSLFYSCDPSFLDYDWPEDNQRKLIIRLTDAPVEAEEVNVDIQGIVIKTDNGFDSVALETAAGVYNLLDYQDGADTLIGNAIIDFENIKEIRLILGQNNSIKINGELFPLTVPSGSQTGLKIKVNIDVTNDELVEILIDFDASESVVDLGNGNYILNPVIKVASILSDGIEEEQLYIGTSDCVRGKGYWKTHSELGPAPLDSAWLLLADSSKTELFTTEKTYLSYLEASSGNDLYIKLAQQYIIAELNVLAGIDIPNEALDAWNSIGELLESNAELQEIPEDSEVSAKELLEVLEAFNDGELDSESCDEEDNDEEEDDEEVEDDEQEEGVACTRSKGYWKTHSEVGPAPLDSAWLELENGSETLLFSTEKSYLSFLQSPGGNDYYVRLAQQYIITELNVLAGVEISESVQSTWVEAGEILEEFASSQIITGSANDKAKDLEKTLKKFNSGELGPESCDDDVEEEEEEEEEEEYENLTEAMIAIINEFYPGADASSPKSRSLCDDSNVLELKINYEGNQIFLIFNSSGSEYLAKYVKISEKDLPSEVDSAIKSNYDGYKVKKAFEWTDISEELTFEVEIQKQSNKKTIVFKKNGDIVCD